MREFSTDQCTNLAAALTYYAVLSLFPALVVVVSLLGVFGQGQRTTDAVLEIVGQLGPASAVDTLRTPIRQLVESPSAGFALIVGLLGALWSASGYVGAFSRAMNRIYEVEEGRPVWKLRPIQLLLTLVGLTLAAAVAFMLAATLAMSCSSSWDSANIAASPLHMPCPILIRWSPVGPHEEAESNPRARPNTNGGNNEGPAHDPSARLDFGLEEP